MHGARQIQLATELSYNEACYSSVGIKFGRTRGIHIIEPTLRLHGWPLDETVCLLHAVSDCDVPGL